MENGDATSVRSRGGQEARQVWPSPFEAMEQNGAAVWRLGALAVEGKRRKGGQGKCLPLWRGGGAWRAWERALAAWQLCSVWPCRREEATFRSVRAIAPFLPSGPKRCRRQGSWAAGLEDAAKRRGWSSRVAKGEGNHFSASGRETRGGGKRRSSRKASQRRVVTGSLAIPTQVPAGWYLVVCPSAGNGWRGRGVYSPLVFFLKASHAFGRPASLDGLTGGVVKDLQGSLVRCPAGGLE